MQVQHKHQPIPVSIATNSQYKYVIYNVRHNLYRSYLLCAQRIVYEFAAASSVDGASVARATTRLPDN